MANIFTQNPMRIDTNMASDYLTTIGASAGLERPIKVVSIRIENPTATSVQTIQDGSSSNNTLYEANLIAVASAQGPYTDTQERLWRNFKVATIQAGAVIWIERR